MEFCNSIKNSGEMQTMPLFEFITLHVRGNPNRIMQHLLHVLNSLEGEIVFFCLLAL